ncbi:rheb small monomeric gtpase [Colletotrichum truncatum]|uniref:Rheb small monomeric gtpase n=1 Tax=Colletotrichum truncatum TaxID=5467 RepID=A0ACC3ZJB7_COLTU|nr:rheb small monomeric gtpase [Colletotrichum truncatum]KAF6791991.1 rheb small monomeric gtpase [Colletotrichum truncatum]
MSTRDGPGVPRKKTTTYGKTSRKRPIHAFLELTNGTQRAGDEGASPPSLSTDLNRDPYDLPDDESSYKPIPRRAVPLPDTLPGSQSDATGGFKKRRLPPTVVAKAEGRFDSKAAVGSQPTMSSRPRQTKSPYISSSAAALRSVKHESSLTSRSMSASQRPKSRREGEVIPAKSHNPVRVEAAQRDDIGLQKSNEKPMQSPKIGHQIDDSSMSTIEPPVTKQRRSLEPRRVRLIDQLAAQNEDSSDFESDASEFSDRGVVKTVSKESLLSTPAKPADLATPKLSARPKQLLSTKKFRSTYGEQRTLKADDSGGDGLGSQMGFDSQIDLSPPPALSKLASFSFEEEDLEEDAASKGGGIIDIHALRQAGANHRFADSMADLLERVGTPQPAKSQSSRTRRTALLELASKLRDKTFVRQFRDQGAKDALFQAIGAEEDIINGFILLSVLLVLFTSYSVPHLVPQLESQGIAQLASRMFDEDEDIMAISIQRRSGISKYGQTSLRGLKSTLQSLEVWETSSSFDLSPRMLALKVLSVLCKDSDGPATWNILASLTDQLFGFVKEGWETSRVKGMGGTEGGVALSLLEGYSIAAMQSEAGPRWTKRYLPVLADILTAAMARPMAQFGEFESTTLKLALNTTNNNPTAAGAFSRGELFRELAATSLAAFELLEQSVRNGAFSTEIYEMLMLMLGVMINTSEHCLSTRQSVDAWQEHDGSPLDKLIEVYLDNRESAVMADSVEKTSVAVAHGYLAILLGYLSLGSQVPQRLKEKSQGKGIKYLLDSIQEFMTLHAKVDTDELTTSLQNLVNELRQKHKLSL